MKTSFLIIVCLLLSIKSQSQTQMQLDGNNVNASLSNHGTFFNDLTNQTFGYEIPKNSGNHTLYAMSFWMTGLETDSTIRAACAGYSEHDLFPGPISDDYDSPDYIFNYGSSMWKITRDQVNYHVGNFTASGYIPDPAIAKWPGNGNTADGIAAQLAPYVDVNGDQIYNPLDGDFPYFQGDMAVYVIMNDEAGPHMQTGGAALGIEVHALFYQYESTDAEINNTTFLNAKVFNRRDTNYVDFRFGIFMDTDIGNATDDYIGSDSIRSLAYGYNGSSTDPGSGGQPGYGTNPPAFGAKMLNEGAGSITYFNIGSGFPLAPSSILDYYTFMSAMWNGSLVMTNGTTPTSFAYSGNPFLGTGWNEFSEGNPPGDRRIILSSDGHDLNSDASVCFDFAFIFNQDAGSPLENVNELLFTADHIQDFYNSTIFPCNEIFLQKVDLKSPLELNIFPNPSNGNFKIQISKPVLVSIYSITGDLVMQEFEISESRDLNLNLESGIYFVHIKAGDEMVTQKIIVY